MAYYHASPPRPSPHKPRSALREIGAVVIVLLVAGGMVGGGILLANHGGSLFARAFSFGQPTPVPSIGPTTAIVTIRQIDPAASISVTQPLSDEVDLVTTNATQSDPNLTTAQQTQILSLFMRGYSQQTFWRWTDEYTMSGVTVIYELHPTELWVITLRPKSCSALWVIWSITPTQVVARGAARGEYTKGTASHLGTGPLPNGLSACG